MQTLCDLTPDLLAAGAGRLDPIERRQARYVMTENQRVLDSVAALRRGDVAQFGELMVALHNSLRDDYEVSSPELNSLVAAALETPGVLGARLTGAGFGGCVVSLVETPQAELAATMVIERYRAITGRQGSAYICTPADGVGAALLRQNLFELPVVADLRLAV